MSVTDTPIKRNATKSDYIELLRFLACLIIFSFHTEGIFISGWIFVEFFFLLSGYFAMRHFCSHGLQDSKNPNFPLTYTFRKFKRILPYTTIAFIYYFCTAVWLYGLKGKEMWLFFLYLPLNLLLLPGTGAMPAGVGITDSLYTGHMMEESLWYLCVLLVAMPIMLYLITYLKNKLGMFLVSFLPLLLYGYLILSDGTIHGWHLQHKTFFALDIRALAGLLIGAGVYYASLWWQKYEYTKLGKILLTLLEVLSIAIVMVISIITRLPYDIVEVLLLALSLSLTFSGKTYTARIHAKAFSYLGKLSLPIYCFHCTTYLLISTLYADTNASTKAMITFIIVVGISIFVNLIIVIAEKEAARIATTLKKLFILETNEC